MSTPRRVLGEINTNARRGKDLTPTQRAKIEGARAVGASWSQIAEAFEVPRSTT